MSDIYTKYLSTTPDDDGLPDEGFFDEVWKQLRRAVRREMTRRGLLDLPPSVLGLSGPYLDEDAMNELLQEVYLYVFLERRENLLRKLRNNANVDGIVILQIRILLTDLQRRNDPIGYRIYELLHMAVTKSLVEGQIHVLGKNRGKVRNTTVIDFDPRTSPERAADNLPDLVTQWTDDLLPELITARGRGVIPVVDKLREKVADLRHDGIVAFRFKDLVDPLKNDARGRWLAVWSEATETDFHPFPAADVAGLHRCVTGKIDDESKKKTREDLARTWAFLRATNQDRNGHMPSSVKLGKSSWWVSWS